MMVSSILLRLGLPDVLLSACCMGTQLLSSEADEPAETAKPLDEFFVALGPVRAEKAKVGVKFCDEFLCVSP